MPIEGATIHKLKIFQTVSKKMRILFTADLHLNLPTRSRRTNLTALEAFSSVVQSENPDAVVVAGDIGSPATAAKDLVMLRDAVESRLLAITLGNHDFWIDSVHRHQVASMSEVVTRFWRGPAEDVGAVLLDIASADLESFCLVGCYGHYDLGQAEPGLRIRGELVTEEIYCSGGMGFLFWNDFRYIPKCGARLQQDAQDQAHGLAVRMDEAIADGKDLIVAVHTCPWRELNGHPMRGTELDMLAAYSGNSLIGEVIKARSRSVRFVMCGHTHLAVQERRLYGITCLNVGADYGQFRGVMYDTDGGDIRWVGEPLSAGQKH